MRDNPAFLQHSIARSEFKLNQAERNGGAIFLNDFVRLDVDESTFEGNTAGLMPGSMGGSGGAIYTQKATLWVTDTLFTNNSSATLGGAIYVNAQSLVIVERSAFNLNKSGNPLQLHSVFIALGGGYLDDVVTIYLDSNPIWGN